MTFEVFPDSSGQYRWRLNAKNGRIIADSAEGYASQRNCLRAIKTMRSGVGAAPIWVQCPSPGKPEENDWEAQIDESW